MTDITQTCVTCGKQFLVIGSEQDMLSKKGFPFPTLCPGDRQLRRLAGRGERTLYRTVCQGCGANMVTSYNPNSVTSKILCLKCYSEYFDKTEMVEP